MKKAYYPRPTMCITQGYNGNVSHQGTYAIDEAGEDGGIDWFLAPFDCVIKKVLDEKYGIWVWAESLEEVECANGYKGYLTIMFGHDNKVRFEVGKTIKEGETLGAEGTSGEATGNHNHFEIGLGKYKGTWYKNSDGVYMLYNAVKPHEYLYLKKDYVIKKSGGYNWTYENEQETAQNYEELYNGVIVSLDDKNAEIDRLNSELEAYKKDLVELEDKNTLLDKNNQNLTEEINEMTNSSFTASSDGKYYLILNKGEIIYKSV